MQRLKEVSGKGKSQRRGKSEWIRMCLKERAA